MENTYDWMAATASSRDKRKNWDRIIIENVRYEDDGPRLPNRVRRR